MSRKRGWFLNNFAATDCITICGMRGIGKSHLAREINALWPRSVVFDPTVDWTDGDVVTSFEAFAEKMKFLNKTNCESFRLIFRFNPDLSRESRDATLNEALRLCYFFKNIQVVVDEVQFFTSAHFIPEYMKNLLFMGRHQGISVLATTQRPSQINKSILSMSSHVFCGQLHEKNDLKAISNFINEDTQTLVTLPKRTFIYFNPETGKQRISTEKTPEKPQNTQNTSKKLSQPRKRK